MNIEERIRDYRERLRNNRLDREAANQRLIEGDETALANLLTEPHTIQELERRLRDLVKR